MDWSIAPAQALLRRLALIRIKQARGESTVLDEVYAPQILIEIGRRRRAMSNYKPARKRRR